MSTRHITHEAGYSRLLNGLGAFSLMFGAKSGTARGRNFEVRRDKTPQCLDILVINNNILIHAIITILSHSNQGRS